MLLRSNFNNLHILYRLSSVSNLHEAEKEVGIFKEFNALLQKCLIIFRGINKSSLMRFDLFSSFWQQACRKLWFDLNFITLGLFWMNVYYVYYVYNVYYVYYVNNLNIICRDWYRPPKLTKTRIDSPNPGKFKILFGVFPSLIPFVIFQWIYVKNA